MNTSNLIKKYETYVSNIERDTKTNERTGYMKDDNDRMLKCYKEILHDLKEEPIVVDKEIELGKSFFPLPSEWILEFKTNWYKDNSTLPKKRLNELWEETERVCQMIYQYQRRAYEKNLIESQPKKDISDKELDADIWYHLREVVFAANRMRDNYSEGDEAVKRRLWTNLHTDADAARDFYEDNKPKASSIPIIDKGENEAIEEGYCPICGSVFDDVSFEGQYCKKCKTQN